MSDCPGPAPPQTAHDTRAGWCPECVPDREKGTREQRAMTNADDPDRLLTPAQVATMFGVHPKTVTRWAEDGRLTPVRTLGGHRRYRAGPVRALLDDISERPGRPDG